MTTYILAYSNSKGKVTMLTLYSDYDLSRWIEKLDRRIEKGTCGGYQITVIHQAHTAEPGGGNP